MTRDAIRATVLRALAEVAPDVDPAALGPGDDLRREAGLDSMDVLHLVIALHRDLGVDVPESDYGRLATLDAATDYLARRLGV